MHLDMSLSKCDWPQLLQRLRCKIHKFIDLLSLHNHFEFYFSINIYQEHIDKITKKIGLVLQDTRRAITRTKPYLTDFLSANERNMYT